MRDDAPPAGPPGKVGRSCPSRACEATASNGKPCQAPVLAGSQFCWTHDPANAEAADAARRAGGAQRARQMDRSGCGAPDPIPTWWPLETAAHARAGLAYVVQEVLAGNLPARDANAAAGAMSALVNVLRASDLERRLELLERTLDHRGKA
ncbi:MAG: hypothetical protein WCG85_11525 [Polyangia bacterium]